MSTTEPRDRQTFVLAPDDELLQSIGVEVPKQAGRVECRLSYVPVWTENEERKPGSEAPSEKDKLALDTSRDGTEGKAWGLEVTLTPVSADEVALKSLGDWVFPLKVIREKLGDEAILDFIKLPTAAYRNGCFWHRSSEPAKIVLVGREPHCGYCERKFFHMLQDHERKGRVPGT